MLTWLLIFIVTIGTAAYLRLPQVIWSGALGIVLFLFSFSGMAGLASLVIIWAIFFAVIVPLNLPHIRQKYISEPLLEFMRSSMPAISKTEQEALDAGKTWWEVDLFSGKPDYSKIRDLPPSKLSVEEQAFLDGPVEELCGMLDDWQINQVDYDLPKPVWKFLKDNQFFAMIIPKAYGGLEFSALGHSTVVMKIAGRSITAAVTVMVPNSLGPGELLMHYGTEKQKDYYLPRLSSGKEIPCFGLTGPENGSDAGAMPDTGVVCHGTFDGKENVLGIRLNWEKRYITLGPVATVLGLAFKLYDPDHLIGEDKDIGITLALIKTDIEGIDIGKRHFTSNHMFMNGPNRGKDVFIPMEWVIGGQEYVGQGWMMLMNCLSEGRAVSLPALSTGAGKYISRYTGAYSRIRKQFKIPIGYFEGVEEALADIAGNTYIMNAMRELTLTGLDQGEVPSVISGIVKYQMTERMRKVINLAMDVHGGHGICMGPKNFLGRAYQGIPISITVEGANILTRSMIVFGQGALRSHPYLLKEIEAVNHSDHDTSINLFDDALFGHIGFIISNFFRSLWLGLSGARFVSAPGKGKVRRYYQQLTRMSSCFALLSDTCVLILGGSLKRKEKISGRLADALSNMYIVTAVLKHYEDQGYKNNDLPLLEWACEDSLYNVQEAMKAVMRNFPVPVIGKILNLVIFPLTKPYGGANDKMGHKIARLLLDPSSARDRLTKDIYFTDEPDDAVGRLEHALKLVLDAEDAERKFRDAIRIGLITSQDYNQAVADAISQSIIDQAEADKILAAHEATINAVSVDEFSHKGWKPQ
ncbi:MAG: acyl-CoA dehydrogenase [endosymbiont of Galathealinum brachiosum]|uniref:Acyl-coenzyme A dehydrogenase n=1 Tax=endosymbiont of Galathealinum brachiosum TaxID=2200906 RepID=A0A370DPG3_9GAMM|nr:MAG: acyl-CoA dehydrogenase [endosymbiont of Galathealinum brachiosum]